MFLFLFSPGIMINALHDTMHLYMRDPLYFMFSFGLVINYQSAMASGPHEIPLRHVSRHHYLGRLLTQLGTKCSRGAIGMSSSFSSSYRAERASLSHVGHILTRADHNRVAAMHRRRPPPPPRLIVPRPAPPPVWTDSRPCYGLTSAAGMLQQRMPLVHTH